MKIGLFGGTFDPPHRGHVALGEAVIRRLGLDALRVLPAAHPYHKGRGDTSSFARRLAMTEAAFSGVPGVVVDPREGGRAEPSYAYDTAVEVLREHPGARLFLIVGGDWQGALVDWYRADELLEIVTPVVVSRSSHPLDLSPESARMGFISVDADIPSISSTEVREYMRRGAFREASQLVPEGVHPFLPGWARAQEKEVFVENHELLTLFDVSRNGRWPFHVAKEKVTSWVEEGRAFVLDTEMGPRLPAFQMWGAEPHPDMVNVIRAAKPMMATEDPWNLALWMARPTNVLCGRRPMDLFPEHVGSIVEALACSVDGGTADAEDSLQAMVA